MNGLTAVSLFAGVGGFDLALERSGVDVVAAVEIDDAARGVLSDRFPNTTLFTDVRKVTGDDLRAAGFVPERGILTGGFPCQDLSVAGRRGGMGEGTRSGLFWEIDRLVAELRPAWVVLENVPGLLSAVCPDPDSPSIDTDDLAAFADDDDLILAEELSGTVQGRGACDGGCLPAHGGAMGLVLGSLADRGYGFAYRVLDAQYLGVPQRRRRVFIVGRVGGDARGPVEVLLEPESGARDSAAREEARADVAGTLGSRAGGSRTTDLDGHGAYIVSALTKSSVGGDGGADDNTAQAGHLIAFDTAQITSATNRSNPKPGDPAPPLAATGQPHIAQTLTAGQSSAGIGKPGRRGEDDVSLVAFDAARISSAETPSRRYVADTLRSHPRPGSNSNGAIITHTLTGEGADAREDGTGRGTPLVPMAFNPQTGGKMILGYGEIPTALTTNQITAVHIAAAVRRLTPLECERLQGFPDRWTSTSNGKPQADAARYRECGNAVAVPVIEWIAGRVVAVHSRRAA